MQRVKQRSWVYAATAAACVVMLAGADWRQFRGNDGTGSTVDDNVPVHFSENENIAWKAELEGRGLSGPIVIGDRVVVTCSSGPRQDRLHVLCFSTADGRSLWERQFWATGRTQTHNKTCVAAPTPASDGERIFAFFSSNDMACLDLDGNLLWFRGLTHDFPNASNSLGMASSLCVVGETVIAQVENDAESFATGLDVRTGEPRWKIDRPRRANWVSPVVLKSRSDKGGDLVLLQSSRGLAAVDPRTGQVAWSFDDGASTISSATVLDDLVFIPANGITAVRVRDNNAGFEQLWQERKLSPSTASPIVLDGRIYSVNRAGVVLGADVRTGELADPLRLKGPFSASPVAAGGHLYFVNEDGLVQVVRVGETLEIVAENPLGETILGTPAIADGALYLRSDDHLWKIAR
jgi:outer membrane protein assembly factor BamB